jgi:hypothetical protein
MSGPIIARNYLRATCIERIRIAVPLSVRQSAMSSMAICRHSSRAELLHVLMLPDSSGPTGLDATGIKESHLNRAPGGQ